MLENSSPYLDRLRGVLDKAELLYTRFEIVNKGAAIKAFHYYGKNKKSCITAWTNLTGHENSDILEAIKTVKQEIRLNKNCFLELHGVTNNLGYVGCER